MTTKKTKTKETSKQNNDKQPIYFQSYNICISKKCFSTTGIITKLHYLILLEYKKSFLMKNESMTSTLFFINWLQRYGKV